MLRNPVTGEVVGVSYELGKELARRLGVPFEVVILKGNAHFLEMMKSGQVDFGSTNASPARAKEMDFAQPTLEIENGFLVPLDSSISSSSMVEADRTGVRIGVTQGSASEIKFTKELKNAVLVRVPTYDAGIKMLVEQQIDVFAGPKSILFELSDKLSGFRVLDGRYSILQNSVGIPKGRDLGMPFLRQFVEDVKSEGLIASAAKRANLRGTVKESK